MGRRVAAAMQAYYEWMPVRVVDAIDRRRNEPQLMPMATWST